MRSYSIGVALGLVGLVLNQISAPILTEETPQFLFGGAAVFLAFLWVGFGPGLLAGAISLLALWSRGDAAGWATAVYLVEAWGAYWIYLRVRSLVFAAGLYWFTAGLVLDLVVYWGLVGLQLDYVVLLFVKQVFNGSLNALIAEGISLGFRLERGSGSVPLRSYLFRRVAFAAALPALALALLLTRSVYSTRLDLADSRSQSTAQAAEARLAQFLRERGEALSRLARVIEIRWSQEGDGPVGMLEDFRRRNAGLRLVGLTDAAGRVLETSPALDVTGRELRGLDISGRDYFQRARETLSTTYSPLLSGRARLYQEAAPEPVMIIAQPLLDEAFGFAGLLNVGLDVRSLPVLLELERSLPEEILTLVDGEGNVVASLDPRIEIGSSGVAWFSEQLLAGPASFSYYPPPDDSLESRLGLDLRHAVVREIDPAGWRVVVERPAESLYQDVVPLALSALALFPSLLLILYAVARRFMRRVSDPLVVLHDEALRVSAGESPSTDGALDSLSLSSVTEVRSLGVEFQHMLEAVDARSQAAARALEESETQLEHLLSVVSAVVWRAEPESGRYTYVSPQAEALLGYPLAAWLEPGFLAGRIDPEDREWAIAERREAIESRRTYQLEVRLRRADGSAIWVRDVMSVLVEDGEVAEVIGVMIDVTASRQLEEQLREADRIESLGRLAGGVAHDFNNLLTAINGYADLLLDRIGEDGPGARELNEIRRAGERAATLTGQLLAFGRRQVLRPKVLDLNRVVTDLAEMLRRVVGSRIVLSSDLAEELPRVRADRGMVEQVLVNLVVNARDAMPEGGTLELRTRDAVLTPPAVAGASEATPGPYVVLEVADTGHGMDEKTRAHIFDPFFTTKERGKGTGLGLSTVHGIVQQSGGHIACESELGRGTTFRVYLPRAVGDLPGSRVEEASPSPGS
ncbi:MAG TPA: ATP-binding protein [Thermoanaerobaculia bacterium]|nr:ATP-binding protein [Thermoanaerobaculia bacterium]